MLILKTSIWACSDSESAAGIGFHHDTRKWSMDPKTYGFYDSFQRICLFFWNKILFLSVPNYEWRNCLLTSTLSQQDTRQQLFRNNNVLKRIQIKLKSWLNRKSVHSVCQPGIAFLFKLRGRREKSDIWLQQKLNKSQWVSVHSLQNRTI